MISKWKQITNEDVVRAIKRYDENKLNAYAKNTFVKYYGNWYPAKYIRALAYEEAFGEKIDRSRFSGGGETASFFRRLGFEVFYQTKNKDSKPKAKKRPSLKKRAHHGVVEQKNCLQLLLNRYFDGDVVSEKSFHWLKTSVQAKEDPAYQPIMDALFRYRGHQKIGKPGYKLRCDFVCESRKIIIEYDERQHFSTARKISLQQYPKGVNLGFSVNQWIESCDAIQAADNHPPSRDETRAYYDSVRDIESARNGYTIIRIKHGDYDWCGEKAEQHLEKIIQASASDQKKVVSTVKVKKRIDDFDWRSLEVELQRIRLAYLKWLFYLQPQPGDALAACSKNSHIYVIDSPYGRTFSLSPAGIGSVYVGGGKGVVKMPKAAYQGPEALVKETNQIKDSLIKRTKQLKQYIEGHLRREQYQVVWESLQNFWWLRLGMHEYIYDAKIEEEKLPKDDLRNYILASIYNKIDLSSNCTTSFSDEEIIKMLHYKFSWHRFGCCSYDCGPMALGKEGYIPYKTAAAEARRYYESHHAQLKEFKSLNQIRDFAAESLSGVYDFQALYHRAPLGFKTLRDFTKNGHAVIELINKAQNRFNEVIVQESLTLPQYTFIPHESVL